MKVHFVKKLPTAKNIYTFHWQSDRQVDYEAGQFIRMNLEHGHPDDRGVSRFFTLSSSPTQKHLTITTKFSEQSSTFKSALRNLKPGASITMSKPEGDFTLPKDEDQQLVLVAGGIGVTPYHSMIQYLSDTQGSRPIHLIYSVGNKDEFAFKDLFDSLGWLKVTYLVGEKLSAQRIKDLADGFEGKLVYLSGPEPMIESLFDQFQAMGMDRNQVRTDYFPGYRAI